MSQSPRSTTLDPDVVGWADRLAELAALQPFMWEGLQPTDGRDRAEMAMTAWHLFAAVAAMSHEVLGHVEVGGRGTSADNEPCLESHVRSHLRCLAEYGGPMEGRMDGEVLLRHSSATGGSSNMAAGTLAVAVPRSIRHQGHLQPLKRGDIALPNSRLDPIGKADAMLHHSSTSSANNLVDEFLDSMVLPSVARQALRESGMTVVGGASNPLTPSPQSQWEVPEQHAPPSLQLKPEVMSLLAPPVGAGLARMPLAEAALRPVGKEAHHKSQRSAVAAASTTSTPGGSGFVPMDAQLRSWGGRLFKPIPLPVATRTVAEDDTRSSTTPAVYYGLLLLQRAAIR